MHFLRDLGRCTLTGTNSPNRFVGHRATGKILCSHFTDHRFELTRPHGNGLACFAFFERFTHANDGMNTSGQGRLGLESHTIISVAVKRTTFGVPHDHVGTTDFGQHTGTDLTGVGARLKFIYVLSTKRYG